MPRRFSSLLMCVSCLVVLTGCAPKVSTKEVQQGVQQGALKDMIAKMEEDSNSKNEMWHQLNLARLYQVTGEFKKSIESFEKAEAILDEYEARAKVSLRSVGSGAGSLLFSKGAEKYYGKGYERCLMHTLNSFNYLMLGDFEGAAVEMRKMEKRQEFWLQETEAKIKEVAEKKAKDPNVDKVPAGYSMRALLDDPDVAAMANNYQDPFSYSLSGMLCSLAKDDEFAQVSYQRACLLNKDAEALLAMSPVVKHDGAAAPRAEDEVDVTVVVLAGAAPSLKVENLRFPIGQLNYTSLDLPALNPPSCDLSQASVSCDGQEQPFFHLLRSDRMAYKTLKDEMPAEVAKAVVRAASKGAMAYAAGRDNQLAGLAFSLIADAVSSTMELSYRNWELLPNSGYLGSFRAKKGSNVVLSLDNRPYSLQIGDGARSGEIVLVSYLSEAIVRIDHVDY